jgi:tRNA (guanine-N7-)-methyltransferase
MAQKKLVRFAAIKEFPNVFEYPDYADGTKGVWKEYFNNSQPLTLELACGKGEYAVGLGAMHPQRNFLGIDIKGNRIFIGAKKALAQGLHNVAFLRTPIDRIAEHFDAGDVSEIWITFPDPQLRMKNAKKRLTHPIFLRRYQQILAKGSPIHLKTDSPVLYRFTKKVIEMYGCHIVKDYDNVYQQATEPELLQIKTHYESLDIAASGVIHYLQFTLPELIPVEKDEALKQFVFETELGRER